MVQNLFKLIYYYEINGEHSMKKALITGINVQDGSYLSEFLINNDDISLCSGICSDFISNYKKK